MQTKSPLHHLVRILAGLAAATAALAADPSPPAPTADSSWQAPTPAGSACGNGLVEAAESCEQCPADCQIKPCQPSGTRASFAVTIVPAPATVPAAVAVRIAYRSDQLQLPATGVTLALSERVKSLGTGTQIVPNDMDHSLRLVLANAGGLGNDGAVVSFDQCKNARPLQSDDVLCWIERCSGSGGVIAGCGCKIERKD